VKIDVDGLVQDASKQVARAASDKLGLVEPNNARKKKTT
jgi:hypothetical protein